LIDLIKDELDFRYTTAGIEGLKADITNSINNDIRARQYRQKWNATLSQKITLSGETTFTDYLRHHISPADAAILLDQWGSLEGHPYYPTWKCRSNLSPESVELLSPEFDAIVPVRIAALRTDMAYIETMPDKKNYQGWFAEQFPVLWQVMKQQLNHKKYDEKEWLPLPIHSWHLTACVQQHYADDIASGILILEGPDLQTRPSMSFRTMRPLTPENAPFIKLPVAIWMTSEMRSLQAKSIHMGPRISQLIKEILHNEDGFNQSVSILEEQIAFHYKHKERQDDAEGKYLSVVFRQAYSAPKCYEKCLPVTVATLLTSLPQNNNPLITELIASSEQSVENWFRQYAQVVLHPVISLYLLYGIGLEAHQQNTQILFSDEGMARHLLIRDFGDGRTYAPLLHERGYSLQPYSYPGILPTVFFDDIEPVRTFVVDACFLTHLHELALCLTSHYDLDSPVLWKILREVTDQVFNALKKRVSNSLWQRERKMFLSEPWSTRSLLSMHLSQYQNYRLQHELTNPLNFIA